MHDNYQNLTQWRSKM